MTACSLSVVDFSKWPVSKALRKDPETSRRQPITALGVELDMGVLESGLMC